MPQPWGAANDRDTRWAELSRTAQSVRAATHAQREDASTSRRPRALLFVATTSATALLAIAGLRMVTMPMHVAADAGLDSQLFALTNQDRASNGVRALNFSGTLENIGEGAPYRCGSLTVYGRSVDMIRRNYFSHVIPGCGTYVWPMMSAYGVNYRSAGENIGWEANTTSASYINSAFMASPDHRANILNGSFTHMGAGSAYGAGWTGVGSPQNVEMFSEEFAQLAYVPPPPPRPRPTGGTGSVSPSRNAPAPAAPAQPPTSTQPPSTPAPTPAPTPTPVPAGLLPASAYPPPVYASGGLLPDSIESVLEAFLVD